MVPVIPFSANRSQKRQNPKDPDYGKRWAIERLFPRLKKMFDLAKNRFVGVKKVMMHVYSCLIAYLVTYLM